jgi:hypothetical protein
MLELARLRVTEAGLAQLVQLARVDVREIDWETRFALALWPLNGFLHLPARADQGLALAKVQRALLPGGFLVIDVPNPHVSFTPDSDSHLVVRRTVRTPEGDLVTSMVSTCTNLARQVQEMTLCYDTVGHLDGVVRRTVVEMDLRFVYRYEMEGLLREAGFVLDGVHGSYDLDPYESDSGLMLFVAHTPS